MNTAPHKRFPYVALFLFAALSLPAHADSARPAWPDTTLGRFQAFAVVQTLNVDLLSHDSATLTLDRWCATHRMADPAKILAERARGPEAPAPTEVRERLKVAEGDAVRHRRVKLRCGSLVLSQADNWYVPARLTAEMNTVLDTTDTAFGRAVRALDFRRRTLSARLLWSPLPEGWDMGAPLPPPSAAPLDMPEFVLQHSAVLETPDGTPFSMVIESYTRDVLAFPPPER